jgi:hypothetical protein
MNSKEIKGLVEAYTEVYAPTQEVDQFEDLSFVDDLSDNELVEIMEEILSEEEVTLQECLDVFDSEILFEESEMEKMNRLMNKRTREKKAAAATAKREKSAERERVGRKHALKRLQVAATRAGRNLADKAKKAGEKAKTLGAGAASAAAGGAAEAGRAAKSKLSSAKEKIKGLVKSGRKAVAGGLRKLASKVEPKETDGKEVKAAAKSAVSSGRKPAPYRIVGKKSGVSGSGGTKALPPVGKTKSGKTLTQSQRDMQTSQQNIRLAARLGEDLELFALQILEDLISEGYATNQQEALNVLESFSDCQVGDIVESYFGEEVSTDTYDLVLEYLYVEGYAETLEEAEWMMANELDAEDIDAILEAFKEPDLDRMRRQEDRHRTAAVRQRGGSRGSYKNRAMKMGSIRGALERGEDPRADGYGGKRAERGNPPEDHRAAFSKNPLNNPPRPVKKPGV